ncbi:hypothetical protein DERP_007448 [Dermatophagoides pteronyssinus]|uniref:Uncharacterized protein n=1 Tax=Dermatophagoides pteronyssinus TaxID=6956 RepID=A0ABQ8J508_DERPT|nr:hypothetical protein DERP_007448 [Dermatophagoides pteronyssinus]
MFAVHRMHVANVPDVMVNVVNVDFLDEIPNKCIKDPINICRVEIVAAVELFDCTISLISIKSFVNDNEFGLLNCSVTINDDESSKSIDIVDCILISGGN